MANAGPQTNTADPLETWAHRTLDVPEHGLEVTQTAGPAELGALAAALDIAACRHLSARYRIRSLGRGRYRLAGEFAAGVTQNCIFTLEPVASEIRETFEEAGLLIGRQHPAPPRSRSPSWHRFFAHGVVPDLEDVVFVARAITPPRRARRFDARFFALDASAIATDAGRIETPADELLELAWLTFDEARTIEIPNITRIVLYEIEQRLAEGRLAAPERPVPFFYMRGRTFTREIL